MPVFSVKWWLCAELLRNNDIKMKCAANCTQTTNQQPFIALFASEAHRHTSEMLHFDWLCVILRHGVLHTLLKVKAVFYPQSQG